MTAALRQSPPKGLRRGNAVESVVEAFMNALPDERHKLDERIRQAGIDPSAIVLDAYEARAYEVRRFEADLRVTETRRRRLLEDLRNLQARRRPEATDAEIVEG